MTRSTISRKRISEAQAKKAKADYYFDDAAADRAVGFFHKYLCHIEAPHAGKPFILEPWQRQIVEDVFGWKRIIDNTRKYRVVYLEVPRKNGKSSLGAGLALYLLSADREHGAQIVSAAADREQASLVFDTAKNMVKWSPKLSRLLECYRKSVVFVEYANSYKVLSADAASKHGKNLHGILFDELHAQPNRELVDVLKTSTGTRSQPLEIYMTTAGYDRTSICYEYHDYAKRVMNGLIVDEAFYPVIYAADVKDDWTDPKIWAKANPNLDVSIKLDYLARECEKAKNVPAYENTFRRLHLNQWTEQESRMISMHEWAKNEGTVNPEELEGMDCYGGLDLASTTDIAAFVLVFPVGKDLKILPRFYVPREAVARRQKRAELVNWAEWMAQGFLTPTDGDVIDYDFIRADILRLSQIYNIRKIAFDRWNATQLTTQLDGDGLALEPFGQGFRSLSAPTKELLKRITAKQFHHGGHPVLSWMAGNVQAEQDPEGNIKPSKKRSKEKIDGIVASVMGIGMLILDDSSSKSVYEERGLISF
jgi:phage terminase large subunit-like protein